MFTVNFTDEPNNAITETESFKIASNFLDNTSNVGIIDIKTAAPLKYLNKFQRTLELLLINCEINLILTW